MAEQGFILDIDTQFLKRLEQADKSLNKMVASVDRVASSLDNLASGPLSEFANSIDQIVASINGLSQTKVGDMGFSEATNSVSQTVDKVNDLVGAIREVSNESAKSSLSFDVSDYESPAKVQALIEKNRAALERAQARLPKWEGRLAESLKTDPNQSKKSTQGVAQRVKEINDEIKSLNDTYNQLSQRLVVARERTQELLDVSRNGGFKDIATMTAIKEAQKERIESGGFSTRAEQQKYVDAYVDANEQIKEQYKSTSDALSDEDEERYQLWLMQRHTEAKEHKRIEDEKYKATVEAIGKQNEAYAQQKDYETKSEKERYELWLMQTHAEAKERNRIEDEKYKATLETIRKQNEEYDKQEAIQKAYDEQNRSAKAGSISYRENYERQVREYEKMFDEIDKRRRENERKEKKRAQSVIDNYIKETEAARKSYEERQKMYERLFKEQEEQERRTLSGSMRFSQGAGSISDRQQAIKYLSEARDSLNESQFNSAKEYKKAVEDINEEINRQKTYVDELQGKHKNLINTADQLKRAFALVFSVSAIRGYVNQTIRVRGEFELQQRALQAILKNKNEANKLWDQTTQLAVRSPYQVKELVTYTKQLAAYRVETEKLHDTTKMLADISSGLGVDMGRLILAFGQVKAANYLRGTELRQFSEAGINILDELARYYTAVEGKAVNVGQVFERVSKRMVAFSDVETVLRNVTSAGGMFYKMQEVQAETLKGSISNFKDQMDLMLNDIGKKNEGVLKLGVTAVSALIKNYRLLAPVLTIASVGFVAMNISMAKVLATTKAIQAGISGMKSALVSPWSLAFIAVGEVTSRLIRYNHEMSQIRKEHERLTQGISETSIAMNDAMDEQKIEDARTALSRLQEMAKNDFKIDFGLSEEELNKLDLTALKKKFDEISSELSAAGVLGEALKKSFTSQSGFVGTAIGRALQGASGYTDSKNPELGESFGKDVEDYQKAVDALIQTLQYSSITIADKLKLPKSDDLRELRRKNESELEYIDRLVKSYESRKDEISKIGVNTNDIDRAINKYRRYAKALTSEVDFFFEPFQEAFASSTDETIRGAINNFVYSNEWKDITREFIYKNLGIPYTPEATGTGVSGNGLGVDDSDKSENYWSELLRTIKDVNNAYKDLTKTFDETIAKEGVMEKYTDALNDVLSKVKINGQSLTASSFMSMFDLTTEEGLKDALDAIAKQAPEAADRLKAKLEKGDITWSARVKLKEESDKDLVNSIEDLFSGYELSIELDKLGVPKEFAKSMFRLDATSLEELRTALEAKYPEFEGSNMLDKYKEYERKIDEIEAKAQRDRLKKYLVYARDAVGERAKIKLEELKKLQEIELTFGAQSTPEKQRAIEKVQSDSYQATKKLDWEEFQKSDTFVSLFQDLDMASESLINHALTKLQEFKDSWKDMPHEEMKSIVGLIEKLEYQLVEIKNPFVSAKKLREELKSSGSSEELLQSNVYEEKKMESYRKEIAILEEIIQLRSESKDEEARTLAVENERNELYKKSNDELAFELEHQKDMVLLSTTIVAENNKKISKQKQLNAAYQKQSHWIQEAQKTANDLYGAFKDLAEVLGESDSPTAMFAEMGMSMANTVANTMVLQNSLKSAKEGADKFGRAMNTAMGIIGWIVMAVQLITEVLSTAFKIHDNKLEKQIQRIQERVEDLEERWERINELMSEAFSTVHLREYSKEAKKNLEEQIKSYEQMIELEERKKKTDHGKVDEWRESMKELKEEYRELLKEEFSIATSGIMDDVLSTTRGFVDAWHDAFMETGDGMSGLKNNFRELLQDIMRQQAALTIVNPFVSMYKTKLEELLNNNGADMELTLDEAREWRDSVEKTLPEVDKLLSNFFEGAEGLLEEQGELSELSKGIQGVTESTAQILEALLNSMRFFVADTNASVKNIESALMSSDVSRNPILNELQQHTQLIRSIESMFDSVIGHGGSTHIGGYIKVKID